MHRIIAVAAVAAFGALPGTVHADTWATSTAPLNQTPSAGLPNDGQSDVPNLGGPVVASVGGRLHAAWTEWDGQNYEVRVARREGPRWVALGNGCSPISSSTRNAFDISLVEFEGRPVVGWSEADARGVRQIHVARFERDGEWAQPWGQVTSAAPDPNERPGSASTFYGGRIRNWGTDLEVAGGRLYVGLVLSSPFADSAYVYGLDEGRSAFVDVHLPGVTESYGFELEGDDAALFAARTSATYGGSLTRFVDGAWEHVSLPAEGSGGPPISGMAVQDGVPYVMTPAGVIRYVGGAWENVGGTVALQRPRLAFVGGVLHASGVDAEGRVAVYKLGGDGTFVPTGDGPGPPFALAAGGPFTFASVDLTSVEGSPAIAWPQWDGSLFQGQVATMLGEIPQGTIPPGARPPGCAGPNAPRLRLLSQRVKPSSSGRSVRLRVRCVGGAGCRGLAIIRRPGAGARRLGRGAVSLAPGRAGTVTVKLSPLGQRLLRRGNLVFRLTFSGPPG